MSLVSSGHLAIGEWQQIHRAEPNTVWRRPGVQQSTTSSGRPEGCGSRVGQKTLHSSQPHADSNQCSVRASKGMIQRNAKMTLRESSCELWSNRVRKISAASETGPLRPGSNQDALHGSPAQARRAGRNAGMAICSSPREIRSIYTQGQSALTQTGVLHIRRRWRAPCIHSSENRDLRPCVISIIA